MSDNNENVPTTPLMGKKPSRVATIDPDKHDPTPPIEKEAQEMEEYKEYQPPLARFRRLRSFLTDSSSRQDPEEVDYNKRNGIPETPASLGKGSPNTPTNAEGEDQGPPPVPKYYTPMPKPAAIATIEGRGNSPSRYIESWKMWRENHNPLNAFTLFALRQYLAEVGHSSIRLCRHGQCRRSASKRRARFCRIQRGDRARFWVRYCSHGLCHS